MESFAKHTIIVLQIQLIAQTSTLVCAILGFRAKNLVANIPSLKRNLATDCTLALHVIKCNRSLRIMGCQVRLAVRQELHRKEIVGGLILGPLLQL